MEELVEEMEEVEETEEEEETEEMEELVVEMEEEAVPPGQERCSHPSSRLQHRC